MKGMSTEEFDEIDRELDDNHRTILKYLAEIREKNLQNPWININTLAKSIDIPLYRVDAAIRHLYYSKLVDRRPENKPIEVMIKQKGFDYVNFNKKAKKVLPIYKEPYFWFIIVIVVFLAFIASMLTNNYLWLISSILGPLISYIIKMIINNPNNGGDT